jgi:hypothetical protein
MTTISSQSAINSAMAAQSGESPASFSNCTGNAMTDIQSMMNKISLLFKDLRDINQERSNNQRATSIKLMDSKLEKKREANNSEFKANMMNAGFSLGGAVIGSGMGAMGIHKSAKMGTETAGSMWSVGGQASGKLLESGGALSDSIEKTQNANPLRMESETLATFQDLNDKERSKSDNKADEFSRQFIKSREMMTAMYKEFSSIVMGK